MPKLKPGARPPPGWDLIEPTLTEIDSKLRDGESARATRPWTVRET